MNQNPKPAGPGMSCELQVNSHVSVCDRFEAVWPQRFRAWMGCLEDHPRTDGYVVNNHGDRFRPLSRVVGPLPNGLNGLYMGVTNHLLSGTILQVGVCFPPTES